MLLLAGWNLAVSQYSGEKDIIIGTPVAGREHADLNKQIGFFVNMLALRNQLDYADTFNQFYEKVKQNTLEGFAHQMYPFDRLVDDLKLIHRTDRSAVFDVLFALQNQSTDSNNPEMDAVRLAHDEITKIADRGETASKFDLEVSLEAKGQYLELKVIFNSDVYEKEMVKRLVEQYKAVLAISMNQPASLIKEISRISLNEKHVQQEQFTALTRIGTLVRSSGNRPSGQRRILKRTFSLRQLGLLYGFDGNVNTL